MANDQAGTNRFVNTLPGVPDVESPFFERLFAEKDLSEDSMRVARELRENGYAVVDFPDPEFAERSSRMIDVLGRKFDLPAWREHGWPGGHSLRVQDAWEENGDVAAVASNPQILALLEEMYGRRAFPFQTLNFPVGTQQPFHTDSIHFSAVPERFMCGVWVALEDIDDDNGPLEYFPGSHKLPIYTNEHIQACAEEQGSPDGHYSSYLNLWRDLVEAHQFRRETFHAKKGQALIWTANLLHGGSKQLDPMRTRWSQVTHYYFEGCTYYTPLMSDPAYGTMFYRDMKNIGTGEAVPNMYSGHRVKTEVMDRTAPNFKPTRPAATSALPANFDAEAYLAANPDVAAAGMSAERHWKSYGWKEGRRLR